MQHTLLLDHHHLIWQLMAVQSVWLVSPGQYTVGTLEKQFVRKSFAQNIIEN